MLGWDVLGFRSPEGKFVRDRMLDYTAIPMRSGAQMGDLLLVTGGAGFIGSHLSERLMQRGYRVRVLDNLSFGRREWVPEGAEFIEGDIQDISDCRRACRGVSGLFHMAAMSRAGPSLE